MICPICKTDADTRVLYTESVPNGRKRRRRFNWITARKLHRISSVLPDTWTLFIHGQHRNKWGFLEPVETEDGSVSWLYHNPFDQSDSGGAHWWAKPDVAIYPPEGVR